MEKLERKLKYISNYAVVIIRKEEEKYLGYILKYDGKIFKDVGITDSEQFITQFPSIKKQLENGFSYHLVYNFDIHKYQSSLIQSGKKEKYQILKQEEIIEDFTVLGNSILDSMIELDHKIAKNEFSKKILKKKLG